MDLTLRSSFVSPSKTDSLVVSSNAEKAAESSLKGHIKGAEENDEGSGSQAYVPPDPKDDVQLHYALDLLRGVKTDPSFPPDPTKVTMAK